MTPLRWTLNQTQEKYVYGDAPPVDQFRCNVSSRDGERCVLERGHNGGHRYDFEPGHVKWSIDRESGNVCCIDRVKGSAARGRTLREACDRMYGASDETRIDRREE